MPGGIGVFMILASVSGLLGLQTQLSYDADNTYEDAFACKWVRCGKKTAVVQVGHSSLHVEAKPSLTSELIRNEA
ncbi:hypothetical protein F5B22DRAFT_651391 [Xylaria bambusicola]|uniref:uncharacterized protein n=1 Tax=Xylaria bambusicola TaxID=326684 RepID=UPI002008D3F5|nr:uncharacterized protein F5B22DRAFT_651391 [Xylaria bambusicola]KAI0505845.1 hypothetical protein F5B22DRAFT_651391 [Xylaria bambusicola]